MKRLLYRFLFVNCLVTGFCSFSSAQDLTGIWRGYFITESGQEYRLEFQVVKKKSSSSVTGVSYSYLDKRFYGKATMTGTFTSKDNNFQIQELRTTEVRNLAGGGTCLMNYKFTFTKSGKELFLEGTYLGKTEDRQNPKNNGVWGDCGGGTVFLRRVESSDFYVEPFLREQPLVKKTTTPPVKKALPKTTVKTTVPPLKNTVVKKPPVKKLPVKTESVPLTTKTRELQKIDQPVVKDVPSKIIVPNIITIPARTRSRENELIKTLVVTTDEITVKLYDNGDIDDDTISVYLDNQMVLSNKRLSASPLSIKIKMQEGNADHILVMVAENLGRIPPNTSLMIVNDGDKRYEVRITSTEQKNAMVRFRYQKSSP